MPEVDLFQEHRRRLFAVAYRMLGSASDAEDVVQDAWLRFSAARPSDLRSPQAYLTTIVTRLCLDRLKSARATREEYVGPWLPEPVLTDDRAGAGAIRGARRVGDPRLHGAARDALARGARRLPAARGLRSRVRRDRGDARHDAGELPPAVSPREAAHRRPPPALSRRPSTRSVRWSAASSTRCATATATR